MAVDNCVDLPVTSGGEITVLKAPAPPGLEAELEGTKARVTYDVGDPPDTCRPDSISITVYDRRKPTLPLGRRIKLEGRESGTVVIDLEPTGIRPDVATGSTATSRGVSAPRTAEIQIAD